MSITTPAYSALGKISSVMICGKSVYKLNHRGTGLLTKLSNDYGNTIDYFQKKGLEINIFYDANGTSAQQTSTADIHYHMAPTGSTIDHRWAQDFFHFSPGKKEKPEDYSLHGFKIPSDSKPEGVTSIPTWMIAPLQLIVENNIKCKFNYTEIFPGGNALLGYDSGKNYLLVGQKENCKVSDEKLQLLFDVESDRILRLPVQKDGVSLSEFYHLDLYVSILGKLSRSFTISDQKYSADIRDIILIAEPHGDTVKYKQPLDTVFEKIKNTPFLYAMRIPCIILKVNGTDRIFSYNNCLIENYHEDSTGARKVMVYMPKYSKRFIESYQAVKQKNNLESMMEFSDSVTKAINSLKLNIDIGSDSKGLFFSLDEEKQIIREAILEKYRQISKSEQEELFKKMDLATQTEIEKLAAVLEPTIQKLLEDAGVTKVEFIDGNFIDEASNKASLHCRIKVLKRDKVTLE